MQIQNSSRCRKKRPETYERTAAGGDGVAGEKEKKKNDQTLYVYMRIYGGRPLFTYYYKMFYGKKKKKTVPTIIII